MLAAVFFLTRVFFSPTQITLDQGTNRNQINQLTWMVPPKPATLESEGLGWDPQT